MAQALQQRAGEIDRRNLFGIFQAQLQLRILCNHGTFQDPYSWTHRNLRAEREDAKVLFDQAKEVKCSLCKQSMPTLSMDQIYRRYTKTCAHVLCDECLEEPLENCDQGPSKAQSRCPICSPQEAHISASKRATPESTEDDDRDFQRVGKSTKIEALISDLKVELSSTKRLTFFCSPLDLFSSADQPLVSFSPAGQGLSTLLRGI